MQTTQATPNLAHRGMYAVIDAFGKENPNLAAALVGRTITTKELYEEIAQWSGLGPAADMLEAEGVPFDEATSPFSKKFYPTIKAIGFEMSMEAMDTDVYRKLRTYAQMFAQSHYVAEQQAAADIINYMTSTATSRLGIDGVALVSAAHPTRTSTWANRPATDVALGPLTLEQAINEMMDQLAYRDYPWVQPGPFNLYCATANNGIANRLLSAQGLPGSADNDKNYAGGRVKSLQVNPFVTQSGYWFLRASSNTNHGLFKLARRGVTIKDGFDIRTPAHVWIAVASYVYGWYMANGTWGSAFV